MKTLIIFDSQFGNTEKVARLIAETLGQAGQVSLLRVGEVEISELADNGLLVVGSPTQQFRPTVVVKAFLNSIPKDALKGVRVAAFDTRLGMDSIKSPVFRWMVDTGGYAAPKIARKLVKKGGKIIAPPEGFFVLNTEGPLKDGELERAAEWARRLLERSSI